MTHSSVSRSRATALSSVLIALFLGGCFAHHEHGHIVPVSIKDPAPRAGVTKPVAKKVAVTRAAKADAAPVATPAPKAAAMPKKAEAPVAEPKLAPVAVETIVGKPKTDAVARAPDAAVPSASAAVVPAPKAVVEDARPSAEPRRAAELPKVAANIPQPAPSAPLVVAPKAEQPKPVEAPKADAVKVAPPAVTPKAPVTVNIQPKAPSAPAADLAVQPKIAAISEDQRTRDTVAKAAEYQARGNFINARALLQDAGRGENGELLLALAETYDPLVLAQKYPRFARAGDTARALELYQRAAGKGATSAVARMDALKAHIANPNR